MTWYQLLKVLFCWNGERENADEMKKKKSAHISKW